jgi:cysteinyl-tRNA synthetase
MSLRLYNTLTRTKEEFRPLDPQNVRMYVCGPTVYDYAHIGNARPVIVFDVLYRLLRQIYGESHVTYVRNITDVDDKINARAREEGVSIRDLTERTAKQFHADIAALGVLPPTVEPRATEHIAEMIAIIERLIAQGHAYAADGHVLFDVPSMKDYGQLSRRSLDEMVAGARVDVAPYKRGDMDFVLWKPSDAETPGWDSPWGRGRPGWHIECSAMSWKHLGEVFDIHGGGIDLVFPHHENEIAQTRCAFGHNVMANVWMHNGFLQVEGQKMSKSLGNFVTINESLSRYSGLAIRYAMLKTHYRIPIDWTSRDLEVARRVLQTWGRTLRNCFLKVEDGDLSLVDERVIACLSDDLNTSEVMTDHLSRLHQSAKSSEVSARVFQSTLKLLGFRGLEKYGQFDVSVSAFVPLDKQDLVDELEPKIAQYRVLEANSLYTSSASIAAELALSGIQIATNELGGVSLQFYDIDDDSEKAKIQALVDARLEARKSKNWRESDRIRDELAKMGIAIKDNKDGTTSWEVKR